MMIYTKLVCVYHEKKASAIDKKWTTTEVVNLPTKSKINELPFLINQLFDLSAVIGTS